jgi:signal transduction histidine kinase
MDLTDALRALVEGFGRRTELNATFEVEGGPFALSEAAVHALYRVAQEALSNVYRHARAKSATVRLCSRGSHAHLIITDDGVGLSDETLAGRGTAGVGLSGMRSRLTEIGGRLTVNRLSPGTAVIASVSSGG